MRAQDAATGDTLMKGSSRRYFLGRVAAMLSLPLLGSRDVRAQAFGADQAIAAITRGAPLNSGKVVVEMPRFTDDSSLVPLTVSVQSAMSGTDRVRSLHIISEKNPVRNMASFHFGPRAGRASVVTSVRLADTQTVTAIAAMADGTFWVGTASVEVTTGSCGDVSPAG